MATIGSFGNIIFEVSEKQVKTIQKATWKSKASYAQHKLYGRETRTEFVGVEPDTFSLEITLSATWGVNPLRNIEELLRMEREGEAAYLVIGDKVFGKDRWTIESSSRELEVFDGKGNMVKVVYSLELLAYEQRWDI